MGLAGAGSTFSGLASGFAAPAAVAALYFSNQMKNQAEQIKNQLRESAAIKKGAAIAYPQIQSGSRALSQAAAGEMGLMDAFQTARGGMGGGAAMSSFVSTGGGQTGAGKGIGADFWMRPVEVAPGLQTSAGTLLSIDNIIGVMRLQDALARSGTPMTDMDLNGVFGVYNPGSWGQLLNYAGPQFDPNTTEGKAYVVPNQGPNPYEGTGYADLRYQGPNPYYRADGLNPFAGKNMLGSGEEELVKYARSINPNFDQSLLAVRLNQLPRLTLAANEAQQQTNMASLLPRIEAIRNPPPQLWL
jgi:hypothetical protein